MDFVTSQLEHNRWADGVVARSLRDAPAVAAAVMPDGRPLLSRLSHLAGVERAFLDVLRERPERPDPPGDVAALVSYMDDTGGGLVEVAGRLGDGWLNQRFDVPWWGRSFEAGEIVAQVLAHSAQHRAEIAWELARAGVDTGELDYIVWTAGGRPGPGGTLAGL